MTSGSLHNWYNSLFNQIRHFPFTFIGPYILLRAFLSNVLILFSSLLLIAQFSHPYNNAGFINVLYSLSLVLILVQCEFSCFLSQSQQVDSNKCVSFYTSTLLTTWCWSSRYITLNVCTHNDWQAQSDLPVIGTVLSSFRASRKSLKIFRALTVLRDELLKEVRVDCEEYLEHKNTLCGTEWFIGLIVGTNVMT